jgi:hypothetical protein
MNHDYDAFIQSKRKTMQASGFDINDSDLNTNLFDFQNFILKKALKMG